MTYPKPTTSSADKAKVRLLSLGDIDQRRKAYRRTADLIAAIEGDLGGADRLSTSERQLIQRAGANGALIEDMKATWLAGGPIDPAACCSLVNSRRRLLETVGLKRQPRNVRPDLQSYLAADR